MSLLQITASNIMTMLLFLKEKTTHESGSFIYLYLLVCWFKHDVTDGINCALSDFTLID